MAHSNVSTIRLDAGREVVCSYGVPVAAFVPGRGWVKTAKRYSMTTSKHANQYARGGVELPNDEFMALVAPVTGRRSSDQ